MFSVAFTSDSCLGFNIYCMTDHWQYVAITSRRYYANSIGYPSESMSSSKSHAWFASRCPGRRLSTWQMIAASCPTALGALCGQLTSRLGAANTQQLLRQNFCSRWTSLVELSSGRAAQSYGPTVRQQLKEHLFWEHEHGAL